MEMMTGEQIAAAHLTDWRKLGQGIHARYVVDDFAAGARFVAAIAEAGTAFGHQPRVTLGDTFVDLKLISEDAVYVVDGVEHVVHYTTRKDLDLAQQITDLAAAQGVKADPAGITTVELALDTADAAKLAPMWSALLTGDTTAVGRGSTASDVRDATGRVPILWFQDTDAHETPRQRFHLDVWVAPDHAQQRIAAAVAAGGVVVDDSEAPSYVVLADPDGNKACVCTDSLGIGDWGVTR